MTSMESVLSPWAEKFRSRTDLPVLLRWGNDVASAEGGLRLGEFSHPKVEILIRKAAALPLLMTPSLDNLGQAYVEGLIDVRGSVEDVLDMAHRLAEAGSQTERRLTAW